MTRTVNLRKTQCAWCCQPAQWEVADDFGADQACTLHGTEWFPAQFPESDPTPIEAIVEAIPDPVSLVKTYVQHHNRTVSEFGLSYRRRRSVQPAPWYPLEGHRKGLRMNDPVTLFSAFMILAIEGRTAHRTWL
jgi:hypothetical protein